VVCGLVEWGGGERRPGSDGLGARSTDVGGRTIAKIFLFLNGRAYILESSRYNKAHTSSPEGQT
jgi:hypothetical protein